MTLSALASAWIIGWSVAWPPRPANAEILRRGFLPKEGGGGFWSAWPIGLSAVRRISSGFLRFCPCGSVTPLDSDARRSSVMLLFLAGRFALKFGAHFFAHPSWQLATESISAAVMVSFAIRLLLHFP
jgi:hypothetical protein